MAASQSKNTALKPLDQIPVTRLKGVGQAMTEKLAKLGLETLQDLLFHLPLRYQDRTRIKPIGQLRPGEEVVIEGVVQQTDVVMGRRRSLRCRVRDNTGEISLRFFHFSNAQKNGLQPGTQLRCFGEARVGANGLEIYHPEYRQVGDGQDTSLESELTPIYPATEGLTQPRIRALCQQSVEWLHQQGGLTDWLPEDIQRQYGLMSLNEAVLFLHRPPVEAAVIELTEERNPAQMRLAFEELLAHHLSLQLLRQKSQQLGAPAMASGGGLQDDFLARLPFDLTGAQRRVAAEIAQDLVQPIPMLRLVQGDVGAGKTVVAALAVLQAVSNGYQAAVMAPTEILAEQHLLNFSAWFEPMGINVDWLTGRLKGKKREHAVDALARGSTQVVIGTHALFQDGVEFANLGLVVIDEQHRFGVHQRLALREKGRSDQQLPHQLIMTATPIPRTLTMSAYADLDCSIIDELPAGRIPINTVLIADSRRDQVIERVRAACLEGRQAYWVCTLIEESEMLQCQAAEATEEYLKEALGELRIGLIHGRLKALEKAALMASFKNHELDLLVATTVIEVGVDVPNASLMIIENPERLGLAQLHQLRGRVGRGNQASHCVLMYQHPLSKLGKERLGIMRETNDGFRIAEKDLEIRGPGEVLGTRQTGALQFRIADLQRDADLLDNVRQVGGLMENVLPHRDAIIRRWLGKGSKYGDV